VKQIIVAINKMVRAHCPIACACSAFFSCACILTVASSHSSILFPPVSVCLSLPSGREDRRLFSGALQ
jgi:hypothetical protein